VIPSFIPLKHEFLKRLLERYFPNYIITHTLKSPPLNNLFDPLYYYQNNLDILEARIDPITHYVRFCASEGRDPSPWFNTEYYLNNLS